MSLEWIDPPRDYRDEAADIANQLKAKPGRWARIGEGERYSHNFTESLLDNEIEYRIVNERDGELNGRIRRVADLYARAPKENR